MLYIRFALSLLTHKWHVFVAGRALDIPTWRLIVHDWQKFTLFEFPKYARYFFGEKNDGTSRDFLYAWIHHVGFGPHHWEYWLLHPQYNFSDAEDGVIPMPEKYIREMVADWMGASVTYTGSLDMSEWLTENLPLMVLHGKTVTILDAVLFSLGYSVDSVGTWSLLE